MDYYGSDAEPEWDSEEEARMIKEIENDPNIDWKQESRDAVDLDNVEEIDGYEDDFEPGSESDGGGWDDGPMMHPSAYKAMLEQEIRKRELAEQENAGKTAEQKMAKKKKAAVEEPEAKDAESEGPAGMFQPCTSKLLSRFKEVLEAAQSNATASTSTSKPDAQVGEKRKRNRGGDEHEEQDTKGKGKGKAEPSHPPLETSHVPDKSKAKKARRTSKEASKADV